MKSNALIYLVEDDVDVAVLISGALKAFGFRVETFHTGGEALSASATLPADVCIVDLGLPDMEGLTCLTRLAASTESGLMVLTGRGTLSDKVLGLELGADDYMTKPFESREVVARVQSLLRRLCAAEDKNGPRPLVASFGDWTYDPSTLLIHSVSGISHTLSSGEANLLASLLRSPNRILSRDQLMSDQTIPYDRSIDSRMSRLRKKLEHDPKHPAIIKTVYGAGYMLVGQVQWRQSLAQ